MNLYLSRPDRADRPATSSDMLRYLGLPPKAKLPEDGMPPRWIQNIKVWVEPLLPPDERRQRPNSRWMATRPHRVMAQCPQCGKEVSAGRLPQHAKVHQH